MNQGIAFTQTLRALDADDFRASKLGLLVAAALLAAWVWWMIAARIPQYESTGSVNFEDGRAVAYFPPDALSRIHANQPALLHFNGSSFPALVQTVTPDHAELVLTSHQPPAPAMSSVSAEIETTRVSPAAIALRTLTSGHR